MKRPYKILLILIGAIALFVLVVVANLSRNHSQVKGLEVDLRYGRTPVLVDEQTVADTVLAAIPRLLMLQVGQVDREAVAEAAARVPYLKDVTASVSVSGMVVVRAAQRRPIARLFYGNRELYFDDEGVMMPVSRIGECDVLVAGGDFVEPLCIDSLNTQTEALVNLAHFLDDERKYRGMIDQIYVERNGNLLMVPKLGDHIIELGDVRNLDTKFENLMTFYRKGMPRAGWESYSQISLKYDGQVVCTKSNKQT